jgi:hypothetical protein
MEPVANLLRHIDVRTVRLVIIVGLLGALAACGATTPRADATHGEVTVTKADNGKTVHLHIGQRLKVVLGGHDERWQLWHRPTSLGPSLRLAAADGGYPSSRPATAVFVAVQAGTSSVGSITDHPCLHAKPPCKMAQRIWGVRVLVTGTA